jgi:hypothetical protein
MSFEMATALVDLRANVVRAIELYMPEIDATIVGVDREYVPLANVGFLIVAVDSPLAPAILSAIGVRWQPNGPYYAMALLRNAIDEAVTMALTDSAPGIVENVRNVPRVENGIAVFVFDTDGIVFAPVSRPPVVN